MCAATIRDGALVCQRDHDDAGHVFVASWSPDRHDVERDEDS